MIAGVNAPTFAMVVPANNSAVKALPAGINVPVLSFIPAFKTRSDVLEQNGTLAKRCQIDEYDTSRYH